MVNIKIISYYLIYITNHPFYGWFVILFLCRAGRVDYRILQGVSQYDDID